MLQLYKVVLDDPVNCEFGYQNTKTPADLSTGVLLYSMPGDNQLSHVEAPHYQRLSQNSNNSFPRSAWECIPPLKSGLCSTRWLWVLTLEHGNQSFATASPSVGAAQVGPPRHVSFHFCSATLLCPQNKNPGQSLNRGFALFNAWR